jgi:hypothetical protein
VFLEPLERASPTVGVGIIDWVAGGKSIPTISFGTIPIDNSTACSKPGGEL